MESLVSLLGIAVFSLIAWGCSSNHRAVNRRTVGIGILLQLAFAAVVFTAPGSRTVFVFLSNAVNALLESSREGLIFVFGPQLAAANSPQGVILAFQVLPFIIIFAALMGILYYLRIIPFIIRVLARFIYRAMGTSGAESLCAASNIFVGIESATTIRPYIRNMTRSELFLVLTVGMATVASSVMAVYVSFLNQVFPTIAGHLISASILSVPAAIVIAKLMEPESEIPETAEWHKCKLHQDGEPAGFTEAVINGANNGAKLAVGVGITLIAFVGLLGIVRVIFFKVTGGTFSVEQLLGYLFYPLTWLMGVKAADVPAISQLLGMRLILTEIPSYLGLAKFAAAGGDPRSVMIASYALCGFAHIASMAIFVGGIGALAPERLPLLARLGFKALLAATLVTLMTGAVAGVFCLGQTGLLGR